MSTLYSATTPCPTCSLDTFHYQEVLYEVPYFGNVLIQSGHCTNCGYRFFDLEYGEVGKPTKIVFTAEDAEDVAKSLVVRSRTGSIHSPDLGFSLEPGSLGEPFITTVEGFLQRVVTYAEKLKTLSPETSGEVDRFIARVREKMERGGFTLVVEDPLGKSLVVPHKPHTISYST